MTVERIRKGLLLAGAISLGLHRGFARDPIRFIDVGARGGLARPWHALYVAGLIKPIFLNQSLKQPKRSRRDIHQHTLNPKQRGTVLAHELST